MFLTAATLFAEIFLIIAGAKKDKNLHFETK